jgi:hypothetical protein
MHCGVEDSSRPPTMRAATNETFMRPFQGWPSVGLKRVGHGGPFTESMATPCHTPMDAFPHSVEGDDERNFPCQTLKISKVSLVVMGS